MVSPYSESCFRKLGLSASEPIYKAEETFNRLKELFAQGQKEAVQDLILSGDLPWLEKINPNLDDIHRALLSLNDINTRLFERAFWYHTDTEHDKKALNALQNGDWEEALHIWMEAWKSDIAGKPTAAHNLAVLYHSRALAAPRGIIVAKADLEEAIRWWRHLIDGGYLPKLLVLGEPEFSIAIDIIQNERDNNITAAQKSRALDTERFRRISAQKESENAKSCLAHDPMLKDSKSEELLKQSQEKAAFLKDIAAKIAEHVTLALFLERFRKASEKSNITKNNHVESVSGRLGFASAKSNSYFINKSSLEMIYEKAGEALRVNDRDTVLNSLEMAKEYCCSSEDFEALERRERDFALRLIMRGLKPVKQQPNVSCKAGFGTKMLFLSNFDLPSRTFTTILVLTVLYIPVWSFGKYRVYVGADEDWHFLARFPMIDEISIVINLWVIFIVILLTVML